MRDASTSARHLYWDFGDGATSSLQNPSHTYVSTGTYTVTLGVSGPGGNDLRVEPGYITVNPLPGPPIASFTASPTSGIAPLVVTFTNTTTGVFTSTLWDFGDGSTSGQINPAHAFTGKGVYTVTLTATGPGGMDVETKPSLITVYEPVAAGFSAVPTSGVIPLQVAFSNQSSGDFASSSWDFGDGATSNQKNPAHTYVSPGVYTVSLTISGPGGTDSEVKSGYISVSVPAPVAGFTASPQSGQPPLNVVFTDGSTGDIAAWAWDFGDGGTSTVRNPSHSYTSVGVYTVTLEVSGPGGSDTETRTDYIIVSYDPLIANFSALPTSGTAPLNVQFSDGSAGDITTWLWDFGDGGISTVQYPSHIYASAGTYTVSLTVSGPGGNDIETKADYITVTQSTTPPDAAFTASPQSGQPPLNVVFTDASTGDITAWSWGFGDGGISTVQNPTHNYTSVGVYTVTLEVSGPGGSDTKTKTDYIIVSHALVIANFSAQPTSGTAPLNVQFSDGSAGDVTTWLWNFGDGATSTVQNPSHSYASAGTYTVSLTVSGPGGNDIETKADYITVSQSTTPLDAAFTANPQSGQPPLNVVFTDGSTGDITAWSWGFGDGGISTVQNPGHIYASAGTYTVSLTVSGPGGSDTETKAGYIIVSYDPLIANFSAQPTSGTAPLNIQFSDGSARDITAWSWDFGDGRTSTIQNPSHTYASAGTYTVSLTVSGPGGSDSISRLNLIQVNAAQERYKLFLPVTLH